MATGPVAKIQTRPQTAAARVQVAQSRAPAAAAQPMMTQANPIAMPRGPTAPTVPGATTTYGTYTMPQPLKPMPASVANNMNLGWNYATGQVVQPLTPQQQAQAYIPPIGNLGIRIPTQTVFPTQPTPMATSGSGKAGGFTPANLANMNNIPANRFMPVNSGYQKP